MNRFFLSPKFVVAATFAAAALGAATAAEARPDVYFSLGFQGVPTFVEPAPVYVRQPAFVAPREVFEGPRFGRYEARRNWEREHDWRRAEWLRQGRHEDYRGGHRAQDHDRGQDRGDRRHRD